MKRRALIFAASVVLSLLVVLATMQTVCYYINRIYGVRPPTYHVTWLPK